MKTFEGKVALVTGGSSGLGAATALQFARDGAKVVIAARRAEQSEQVLKQIQALGAEGLFVRADVSKAAEVQAMVEATLARFGRLDMAVNNAGIAGPVRTPLADVEEAQWDALMDINLKGVWLCMKYEIPAMLKLGAGAIVNVSSMYGQKPAELGHAPYCASKHAVVGLSQTAAIDYGQMGLRINVVAPGFTKSEMVNPDVPGAAEAYQVIANRHSAMGRLGTAEETANAITWLCSDAASFVSGAVLTVSGGFTTRGY